MKVSIFTKFLLAFIMGLVTVFLIDPLDPSTISTPFCLGILLMAISLRQPTSLVVAVGILYCVLTVYALLHFHRLHEIRTGIISPHPFFWLFQRGGLFVILSGMAIYLSYYRTDTERVLTRLRTILSKLPAPVILSDASGNIVYANEAVTPILLQTPSDIVGKSYFDYFLTEPTKGKSIRTYFELFETDTNGIFDIRIPPFGDSKKVSAQLICLGAGPNRIMITVFQGFELASTKFNPAATELVTNIASRSPKL